jgi:hypothetical protein
MERADLLQRRLRERRYALAARGCRKVLEGIGISVTEAAVLGLDEAEAVFAQYATLS